MLLFAALLISFLTVRGFRCKITGEGLIVRNTESFLWLVLLLLFAFVIRRIIAEKDRRRQRYALLFGIITAIFYVCGVSMEKMKGIAWIWANSGNLINVLNLFFSHTVLYSGAAYIAFGLLKNRAEAKKIAGDRSFSFKRVLLYWVVLFIVYLPWYLNCFPGIVTPDSADQLNDVITTDTLRDHHSAFLVLVMRAVILPVRHFTGSMQSGTAVVSLLQMLTVTFVFALTNEWIRRYTRNFLIRGLVFLWYALFPVNNLYSVTLWKDILFSICFLGLMLCADAAAEDEKRFFTDRKNMALLLMTLVFLPLMRHNGIVIVLGALICFWFRFAAHRKKICLVWCGFALLFGLWKLLLLPGLHAEMVTSGQGLSVLEQQMARAMAVHHEELTDGEMKEFTAYFDIEDLWTRYDPIISDPVKRHFRDELFDSDPGGFFALWAKLGRRYPVDYLEAFFANNYGYWFPETIYWVTSYGVSKLDWDIEDVHAAPVIRLNFMERVHRYIEDAQYAKNPLLPLLFSRGACFWMWLFCGIYCLYNNRGKFLLFAVGASLWLSILISPVYNEFRYVYGLFIALPLMLLASLTGCSEGVKGTVSDSSGSGTGKTHAFAASEQLSETNRFQKGAGSE